MDNQNTYTDREINAKFESLRGILVEIRDDHLVEIKTQVTKTNGRVSSLENWKYLIIGGMTIISMMVIPLVIYIYNTHSTINDKIEQGLRSALSAYNIE